MGSQLARDDAQEYGARLSGLLLSGTFRCLPGCGTETAVKRLEQDIEREGCAAVSDCVPTLFGAFNESCPHRTGYEWLSRDERAVEAYVADPDCGFAISAGPALAGVPAVTLSGAPAVSRPAATGTRPGTEGGQP